MSFDLEGLIIVIVLVVFLGPQVLLVLQRMYELEEEEKNGLERTKRTEKGKEED